MTHLVEKIGGPRALDVHETDDATVRLAHHLGHCEEALDLPVGVAAAQDVDCRVDHRASIRLLLV